HPRGERRRRDRPAGGGGEAVHPEGARHLRRQPHHGRQGAGPGPQDALPQAGAVPDRVQRRAAQGVVRLLAPRRAWVAAVRVLSLDRPVLRPDHHLRGFALLGNPAGARDGVGLVLEEADGPPGAALLDRPPFAPRAYVVDLALAHGDLLHGGLPFRIVTSRRP